MQPRFAGDGDVGPHLLAQPELTEHAVSVLGWILLARSTERDPYPGEDFAVRLRADGARDLRLVVESGQAGLELADDDTDGPRRDGRIAGMLTLVIWGRRPDEWGRFRSHMPAPMLVRLQALLSGH
ncbi:MAG: hypothetical protein ACRDZQ_03425 [Acidimicrobiales bacterium]